jgi:hypothetical protein
MLRFPVTGRLVVSPVADIAVVEAVAVMVIPLVMVPVVVIPDMAITAVVVPAVSVIIGIGVVVRGVPVSTVIAGGDGLVTDRLVVIANGATGQQAQ